MLINLNNWFRSFFFFSFRDELHVHFGACLRNPGDLAIIHKVFGFIASVVLRISVQLQAAGFSSNSNKKIATA